MIVFLLGADASTASFVRLFGVSSLERVEERGGRGLVGVGRGDLVVTLLYPRHDDCSL